MPYQHIEIELNQAAFGTKMQSHTDLNVATLRGHTSAACGDVFWRSKKKEHTTLILCDGKGHGIKANIAATMNISYIENLLEAGFSTRAAADKLLDFFAHTGYAGSHYSVFAIARIFNDGMTNILYCAIPPPILISDRGASLLTGRQFETEGGILNEAGCYLKNGEAIILMSDGVTAAGIGRTMEWGWTSDGLIKFINNWLQTNASAAKSLSRLPADIMAEVNRLSAGHWDDDITVAMAACREGQVVNFLSGPPADKKNDALFVRKFMALAGKKVLAGGTTSAIVAKTLNKPMELADTVANSFTPPSYCISGIDLATEGAVTLNQLYNILEVDRTLMPQSSPVTQLYDAFIGADKIQMFVGGNNSASEESLDFIQRGILPRKAIIPLIAEKLQSIGKLVVTERI